MNLNFLSLGILLGVAHAFFLAAYLLSLKSNYVLNFRILAALLLSMGMGMAGNVVHRADFFLAHPYMGWLFPANEFLYGPLFFLYVVSMLNRSFGWKRSFFLHFIPSLLFLAFSVLQAVSFQNFTWEMNGEFLKLLISIQFLVYLFASFKVWLQHSVMIQNYYASLEKIRMNWLRNILFGMCFIYLISLSSFVFTGAEILKLAPLLGAVLIYVTAYLGMKHSRLFATAEVMEPSPAHFQQKNDKYRNSTLGEDRKQEILFKMKDCMQHEKLFTDNKLTLPKLAARMEVSTHHLSQVLNENLGQTFFDYVNEFRVKEVQKLMIDPAYAHYSLLGMAMEAGFNSKSAFNTAFKKHTQQTPLEYRNSFKQKHEIKSDPIGKGASW